MQGKADRPPGTETPGGARIGPASGPGDGYRVEETTADRSRRATVAASVRQALDLEARFGHGFLWIPVAMAFGAAIWFAADQDIALWALAAVFVPVAVGTAFLSGFPFARYGGLLVCAGLVGMIAAAVETQRRATTLLDSPVTTQIKGTVVARDIDDRGRWRYTIAISGTDDPVIGRPPERVRLLARSRHEPVGVGEGITGLARLQPPSGPALPGLYDFAFNAYFQGLGAFGFFYGRPDRLFDTGPVETTSLTRRFAMAQARFREQIAFRIRDALPGDVGAFASALTVADRRAMSPESVEALRASGLAHVLAISGLHMALVAGTVFFALRTGLSLFPTFAQRFAVKKVAAALSLLVATAYLLISGASVSTQRAWLMLVIVLVAVMVDRPALTLRNVALAAICIILLTPSAVVGPGFQMSFAATAALIAAYAVWRRAGLASGTEPAGRGSGVLRVLAIFFVGLAVTSLVAGLATAPFATFHFHRVASYGLIANLAAMPLVSLLVMPAGLVSVLVMPLGLEHWPLQLMGLGLEGVLFVAAFVQDLGGHLVTGRLPSPTFVLLTAGFLILVLLRSWLRLFGLPIIALAFGFVFTTPTGGSPELLVSEDGRMVALVSETFLASNRSRPSAFIFQQWQRALRRETHVRPGAIGAVSDSASLVSSDWNSILGHTTGEAGFQCLKDTVCLGSTLSGQRVAVVTDLMVLGAACDWADIVITGRSIEMKTCRSGALLITGRMLRQTGALEISAPSEGRPVPVATAIGQANRPWTVHRSYDWRRRSYEFDRPDWAEPQTGHWTDRM